MKNLLQSKNEARLKQDGFTLIELMVVIIIIGILVKIAVPAYTASLQKSYRTDAKTALLDLATREEKFYSVNNAYTGTATSLNYSAAFPLAVQSGSTSYYTITASVPASGAAATFTATASPTGTQASDPCGSFTITNTGVTGNTGGTQTTNCW
jgi:type IV pilus assembly protein PilE